MARRSILPKLEFNRMGWFVAGLMAALLLAVAAITRLAASRLDIGDAATWAGAVGSILAAIAAAVAGCIALHIANKTIRTERDLRRQEADDLETERRRRASLHAAAIAYEVRDLAVRSIAWSYMLKDSRFRLPEMYEHVMQFEVKALERVMDRIDYFEISDGVWLARLLNTFLSTRDLAKYNRGVIDSWTSRKREEAHALFLTNVGSIMGAAISCMNLCVRIGGIQPDGGDVIVEAQYIFREQARLRDTEVADLDSAIG